MKTTNTTTNITTNTTCIIITKPLNPHLVYLKTINDTSCYEIIDYNIELDKTLRVKSASRFSVFLNNLYYYLILRLTILTIYIYYYNKGSDEESPF